MEAINRRRFVFEGATVLGAAALGAVGAANGEGPPFVDIDRPDRDGRLAALAHAGLTLHQARLQPGAGGAYEARLARELAVIRAAGGGAAVPGGGSGGALRAGAADCGQPRARRRAQLAGRLRPGGHRRRSRRAWAALRALPTRGSPLRPPSA